MTTVHRFYTLDGMEYTLDPGKHYMIIYSIVSVDRTFDEVVTFRHTIREAIQVPGGVAVNSSVDIDERVETVSDQVDNLLGGKPRHTPGFKGKRGPQ
jgi:hypothetical protein